MNTRTLILMRHASAEGSSPGGDFERELTARGAVEAKRTAEALEHRGYLPRRALCSSSRRTRATFQAMSELGQALGHCVPEPRQELYLASAERIGESIAALEPEIDSVLVIAHNPGIHELARELAWRGEEQARAAIARGFAPASAAIFECTGGWHELAARTARLRDMIVPQ